MERNAVQSHGDRLLGKSPPSASHELCTLSQHPSTGHNHSCFGNTCCGIGAQAKLCKEREKKGELERIDIENFKGEIRHVKNNEPGKYRKKAARKKVGKKKKSFQAGKSYISSTATAKKWARKKMALESGKIHPHAQSKRRT